MADRSGIKVTASDALEFESVAPKARKGGGVLKTTLFVLIAVIAGASGWAFYGERLMSLFSESDGEVPIIRADINPVKVRPDNPGGLQVPNRDILVYERLPNGSNSTGGAAPVERLLPPPETPLAVPRSSSAESSGSITTPVPEISNTPKLSDVESAVKPAPAPEAPTAPSLNTLNEQARKSADVAPSTSPTRLSKNDTPPTANAAPAPPAAPAVPVTKAEPSDRPEPERKAAAVAAPSPAPTATQAPSTKVYRVQLAAARSEDAARKEWDRLRRGNLDLLGDLGLSVTKVDLGSTKGIFYRLRAGPLANDGEARTLCKALAKRKVGCLVVRPGK